MGKKKKKRTKTAKVNPNLKQIQILEKDLFYTNRAMEGRIFSEELNILFTNQANRIIEKIKKLKENNDLS